MVLNNRPGSVTTVQGCKGKYAHNTEKKGVLSREIENIQKKANVSPRTEKYRYLKLKIYWMCIKKKIGWQRNESVDLKMFQWKLSNLKKRKNG